MRIGRVPEIAAACDGAAIPELIGCRAVVLGVGVGDPGRHRRPLVRAKGMIGNRGHGGVVARSGDGDGDAVRSVVALVVLTDPCVVVGDGKNKVSAWCNAGRRDGHRFRRAGDCGETSDRVGCKQPVVGIERVVGGKVDARLGARGISRPPIADAVGQRYRGTRHDGCGTEAGFHAAVVASTEIGKGDRAGMIVEEFGTLQNERPFRTGVSRIGFPAVEPGADLLQRRRIGVQEVLRRVGQ